MSKSIILCPYCKSKTIVKHGLYNYKDNAEQRYQCKVCNKLFLEKNK